MLISRRNDQGVTIWAAKSRHKRRKGKFLKGHYAYEDRNPFGKRLAARAERRKAKVRL